MVAGSGYDSGKSAAYDSDGSVDSKVGDQSGGEDPVTGAQLKAFYDGQKRQDAKEVTLELHSETLNHYFKNILSGGEMREEGRDDLDAKYYLGSKQFERLRPPTLYDGKLYTIQNKEVSAGNRAMLDIHKSHRKTVSVGLKSWEVTAKADAAVQEYLEAAVPTHGAPEEGPLPEFTLPTHGDFCKDDSQHAVDLRAKLAEGMRKDNGSKIDSYAVELAALRHRVKVIEQMYGQLLVAKQIDYSMAQSAAGRHAVQRELTMDLLTLVGQEDLAIKRNRENTLKSFLSPRFNDVLKIDGKREENKRKRHYEDYMLHHDIDSLVTKESKASKVGPERIIT